MSIEGVNGKVWRFYKGGLEWKEGDTLIYWEKIPILYEWCEVVCVGGIYSPSSSSPSSSSPSPSSEIK